MDKYYINHPKYIAVIENHPFQIEHRRLADINEIIRHIITTKYNCFPQQYLQNNNGEDCDICAIYESNDVAMSSLLKQFFVVESQVRCDILREKLNELLAN